MKDSIREQLRRSVAWPKSVPRWVWFAYAGSALLYGVIPVVTYLAFRQPAFDLAIYDQTLWLLSQGKAFNTVAGIHVFGAHFAPILLLVSPLAHLPGGAIPELVFEALILASAVFPLRRLAQITGGNERRLVFLGLAHAGVFTAAWWGVRPWTWAFPFLLWAVVWMLQRPTWTTVAGFGLAALLFREDIGFWVGLAALSLAIGGRIRWREVILGGIPVALATFFIVRVLMPTWSPIGSYLYETAVVGGGSESAETVVASSIARVLFLLLPVMLVSANLAAFRWLMALPALVPIVGLARRGGTSLEVTFHYELLFVVLLVLIVSVSPKISLPPTRVVVGSLIGAVAFGILNPTTPEVAASPFGVSRDFAQVMGGIHRDVKSIAAENSSLSVPNPLVAHFSERERIFIFPYPFDSIDPEPYPMGCAPPHIVVAAPTEEPTPNWDRARDTLYVERSSARGLSIFELRPGVASDGPCGPDPSAAR